MRQSFLEQMAGRYKRRGYKVYGIQGAPRVPPRWKGPFPDMYVEKGRSRVANLVRADEDFKRKRLLQRVRLMLRNRGVHIRLLTFSQNSYRLAHRFRRHLNWLERRRVHIVRVSRVRRAKYEEGDSFREQEHRRTGRWIVAAVLFWLLLAASYYYFFPFLRWNVPLDSGKGYQPRDVERAPRPKAQPGARSAPEGPYSDTFYE